MGYFTICDYTPHISDRVICSSERDHVNEANVLLISGIVPSER